MKQTNRTVTIFITTATLALTPLAFAGKYSAADEATHGKQKVYNRQNYKPTYQPQRRQPQQYRPQRKSAAQQLREMKNLGAQERYERQAKRANQRAQDNYRARTGQDWEGRKEIRRLQKRKDSIAHQMRNARGSKASSLRQQMRSIDDEISRRQGYRPPERTIVDINLDRR